MATRRKEQEATNGSGKGKIKFCYMDSERVVDFRVENMSGDSVTDGLHSIANALAGRTGFLAEFPSRPSRVRCELQIRANSVGRTSPHLCAIELPIVVKVSSPGTANPQPAWRII
jgi:hypothetical protein